MRNYLWGRGKKTYMVKRQQRKEKWMSKNEGVEYKSHFSRRRKARKRPRRKSKAINKRNETVGMKRRTWKGYKMAKGTHTGGNKCSFIYSYFCTLCHLPSRYRTAPQIYLFIYWGAGGRRRDELASHCWGIYYSSFSSCTAGRVFIEITWDSGWHFFRNVNIWFGIKRKIY